LDGELSWKTVNSYDIDSTNTVESWQHKMYEFSKWRCAWITIEVHEEEFRSYQFNGTDPLDMFIS
jgi:hypothetical protein